MIHRVTGDRWQDSAPDARECGDKPGDDADRPWQDVVGVDHGDGIDAGHGETDDKDQAKTEDGA